MVITKRLFRILSYIYRHGSVPYSKLNRKFKYPTLLEDLENLILQQYVAQVGGSRSKYGEPIPILENTLFTLNDLGIAEVESKQWFNLQFVFDSNCFTNYYCYHYDLNHNIPSSLAIPMPIKLPIIPQMVGIADSFRMSIMLFHLLPVIQLSGFLLPLHLWRSGVLSYSPST